MEISLYYNINLSQAEIMNIGEKQKIEIEKSKQGGQGRLQIKSEAVEMNQSVINLIQTKFESLQKFKPCLKKGGSFTKQELLLFAHKFNQFKSRWTLYTKIFKKTEKEVKNLFYNSLRKLATQLSNAEKKKKQFQKNKIKALVLHNLINISFTVKECFENMQMDMKQLLVFKIKDKIFEYCFINTEPSEEEILELSKNIRKLKFGLKNLKVGKAIENQKQALKLTETMMQCQEESQMPQRIKSQIKQPPINGTSQPPAEPHQKDKNEPLAECGQFYYDQNFLNYSFYPYLPIPYPYVPLNGNYEFINQEQNLIKAEQNAQDAMIIKNEDGIIDIQ